MGIGAWWDLGSSGDGKDLRNILASRAQETVGEQRPVFAVNDFGSLVKLGISGAETGESIGRGQRKVFGFALEGRVAFADNVIRGVDNVSNIQASAVLVLPTAEFEVGASLARCVGATTGTRSHFLCAASWEFQNFTTFITEAVIFTDFFANQGGAYALTRFFAFTSTDESCSLSNFVDRCGRGQH